MDSELIGDLLFGPAQPLPGSGLDDETLLKLASEEFPGEKFCIVRRWMLIDLMFADDQDSQVRSEGLQPSVIYAQEMITKTGTKVGGSHGVLSGFQLTFEHCFFQTEDMLYILAGRGSRKFASKPAVSALAHLCGSELWEKYEDRSVDNPA